MIDSIFELASFDIFHMKEGNQEIWFDPWSLILWLFNCIMEEYFIKIS